MKISAERRLQKEREKLYRIVYKALIKGAPVLQTRRILVQSNKVDRLINGEMA